MFFFFFYLNSNYLMLRLWTKLICICLVKLWPHFYFQHFGITLFQVCLLHRVVFWFVIPYEILLNRRVKHICTYWCDRHVWSEFWHSVLLRNFAFWTVSFCVILWYLGRFVFFFLSYFYSFVNFALFLWAVFISFLQWGRILACFFLLFPFLLP